MNNRRVNLALIIPFVLLLLVVVTTTVLAEEMQYYKLGDVVWYDQDQDGIQEPNEPGYNSVYVDLYDTATCSGTRIASSTTAAGPAGFGDGFYQFTDLPTGDYCIQFGNIPAGWSISPANQGADDTVDSDTNSNAQIPNISLTADDHDEDMGIYVSGSLGDSVVCLSTGEGLANITVTLFEDFDGDGVADGPAIATTETDATGFYLFTGLEVALTNDPNNLTQYIVQVDANDPDLGVCNVPVPPTAYNPSLDSDNPNGPNNDFSFRSSAIVGDRVWFDNDGDGVQDAGEPGIPGVTVDLKDPGPDGVCGTGDNVFIASDVTDANGNYLFTDLPEGTYCVVIDETTLPADLQQTYEKDGSLDGYTQQPLAPGDEVLDVDFGYQPLGSIGDTVWEDDDGDGVQDAGEPGIPGVTVNLNYPGPDDLCGTGDDVFIASDVTDANGNYLFTGLPDGTYCVDPDENTVPAGYLLTTNNDPETVDLGPGEDYLGAEFGFVVANQPPVADPNGPYLGAVNTDINFDGTGSFDPDNDQLTYNWNFGDENTGIGATAVHSYDAAGIYDVCLIVNDGYVDSSQVCTIAIVYDPDGGFVTGGGWIESPIGNFYPSASFGGNYYELGYAHPPVNWADARILASSKEIEGCGSAHLATVTSQDEQDFVSRLMSETTANGWLGGFQEQGEENKDANWQWITEESFDYLNWAGGEPNDTPWGVYIPGSEQFLETLQGSGEWNDAPVEPKYHYIIEYENCDPPIGIATFGFVSKYKKGAKVPTGNTEFQFHAADLNFHSSSYDWLVVTGSDYARFKGTGTINGELAPNGQKYKFKIWASDGISDNSDDTFRIKIWYEVNDIETVVYDNGMDQEIGGGSIVVHTKK